jgi:prevent-host-death family protein
MCYRVYTLSNRVGIRELRQHASGVLKRVVGGEAIDITDRGHPIARIVPLRPGAIDQLVAEGRATETSADLLELAEQIGLPVTAQVPPSEALEQLRADER